MPETPVQIGIKRGEPIIFGKDLQVYGNSPPTRPHKFLTILTGVQRLFWRDEVARSYVRKKEAPLFPTHTPPSGGGLVCDNG